MEVALITAGEELLAGDTENTNATWLAQRLTERGVTVTRILVIPDDRETLTEHVRAYSDQWDAVIVTGGIGSTPDDVTMEAVRRRLEELHERVPDLEVDVDERAEASVPAGSRPLLNEEGLAPGCVLENVYVLPGIPGEMTAMFESVAEEFDGETVSETLYTVEPESNIVPALRDARERFGVSVGCYPDREARFNRLKLTGTDADGVAEATAWLREEIDASETPVERDWVE